VIVARNTRSPQAISKLIEKLRATAAARGADGPGPVSGS
jgi:hypothetical protein